MSKDSSITLAEKALHYACTHLQAVRICWLDRESSVCDAVEAVTLCSDLGVSGRIIGVAAQDQRLTAMLHQLLDEE